MTGVAILNVTAWILAIWAVLLILGSLIFTYKNRKK